MPRIDRPPDSTSSVDMALASSPGSRYTTAVTMVSSLTRSVFAASQPSAV